MSRRCWRGRAGFPTPKNRVDLETEEAVVAYAVEYPAHGQVRVSNELRKRGVFVSPSGYPRFGRSVRPVCRGQRPQLSGAVARR